MMVDPNADPVAGRDWELCIPANPEGSLRRFIVQNLKDLIPVNTLIDQWRPNAERVPELVFLDTTEAIKANQLTTKIAP